MTHLVRPMPPHPECGLAHHRPGHRVKWNRFSWDKGTSVIVTGTVINHERRVLTVRCEPDGRILQTSCGCAAPA